MIDFFKSKKVLITGSTGFKGSWLSYLLSSYGANVYGYALKPLPVSNFNILNIEKQIEQVYGDIRDKEKLKKFFDKIKPEIVFHLAAQAIVRESYVNPVHTFETNIIGSTNILDCVLHSNTVRSLVYITSDKCYENKEWIWGYRENDELGGKDPYSSSKACAELVFNSYLQSFPFSNENKGIASARAGNVIGGGDFSADRLVPDCIRAVENKKSMIIRNPNSTRPWQHVLEPISGYMMLSKNLFDNVGFSGSWNFGPISSEVGSVEKLANGILKHFDSNEIEFDNSNNNQYESNLLQLNCDKANSLLDWHPKWDLNQTINHTAMWYKHYLDKNDMSKITSNQIDEYFGS